jgi:hypothetical protein
MVFGPGPGRGLYPAWHCFPNTTCGSVGNEGGVAGQSAVASWRYGSTRPLAALARTVTLMYRFDCWINYGSEASL